MHLKKEISGKLGRGDTMRIALDGTPLLIPKTGIGRYTFELAKALGELPAGPRVVFFYGRHWAYKCRKTIFPEKRKQVTDQHLTNNKINWIPSVCKEAIKGFIPRIEAFFFRPNLFHATNYISEHPNLPFVTTVHDLSFIRFPDIHPEDRLEYFGRHLQESLQRARKIIAVSEFTRSELVSLMGVSEENIRVVYNGVSNNFKPIGYPILRERLRSYALQPGKYILSVGTLEPRKNILPLLHAYEHLFANSEFRLPLVIVGMRGWKDEAISARIKALADEGFVRALGYVKDEDLPALYSGAMLFVYPSLYEGFGLPPLEAMACGAPVIVSNRGSLPEIVGNAGIYVNPTEIRSMIETIRFLASDPCRRKEFGMIGKNRAIGYSWHACADKTRKVYREALYKAP